MTSLIVFKNSLARKIMQAEDLKIFLTGTERYFDSYLGDSCEVEPPYLMDKESTILEYTGMIGVTGKERGAVYFTANQPMLYEMLRVMLPLDIAEMENTAAKAGTPEQCKKELDSSIDEACLDIVGEIANTIAGNSREHFGEHFNISVPLRLKVKQDQIQFPKEAKTFIIPLRWRKHRAFLFICLE
jgi:chemotaxis protein CheX